MIELNELESKYFDLTEDKISAEDFENWVYKSKQLEKELNKNDYLQLISLDFNTPSVRYEIEKILANKIDKGKFETLKFLRLLESIITRDGKESESLMRMYDLYCDGYSFLQDLGLGIGLHIEVPPSEYKVDYFHELNFQQKEQLVNDAYPTARELATELKNWILDEKLILTGEVDSDSRWEYIDKRSESEIQSKVWKTVEETAEIKVQQNLWLDKDNNSADKAESKKSWWQKLFE